MACAITTVERVLVVTWGEGEPTISDVARLLSELEKAYRRIGVPLLFVAVIPVYAPVPSDAVRRALTQGVTKAFKMCEATYYVMEGTGFTSTIKRSTLAAISLLTAKRGRTFVHASVSELFSKNVTVRDELVRAFRQVAGYQRQVPASKSIPPMAAPG